MEFRDAILLLHPTIAVIIVFPLIGVVVHRAIQTRQRRLQIANGEKSKIPPIVGPEHVQIGRWLAISVVGVVLLALAHGISNNIVTKNLWSQAPLTVGLLIMTFVVTIGSLTLLCRANTRLWRAIFATLTGMSLVILGCQDGIYRKTDQWYFSHYYYGMTAVLLMIFSLAILRDIYQDRTHRWRNVHIILNSVALLIFMVQGYTGSLSLLEIPLHWQKSYIQQLYQQKCNQNSCVIQPTLKSLTAP